MDIKEKMIAYLNNQTDFVTAREISLNLNVSIRTIQNYIKQIKEETPNLLSSGQKGVKLNVYTVPSSINNYPKNAQERESYILRKTLINDKHLNIESLSNYFCVSYTTLQNEIIKIRKDLSRYNIKLRIKNDELFVEGTSKDRKSLISKLIYNESKNQLISLDSLNDLFRDYDAYDVRNIILEELHKFKFFIDEYSLINLLLHILIAMDQYKNNGLIVEDKVDFEYQELNHHFVEMVDRMCKKLESTYKVKFSSYNKYQFSLLLMTRAIRNVESQEIMEMEEIVNQAENELVNTLIDNVKKLYDVDLDVDEFRIGFSLHLKNMLIRIKEDVKLHNPLLASIKITSPFIYDIAIYMSNVISEEAKVKISEDEIAYIALHVGARIEEIRNMKDKLTAVLVCPQYYTYSSNQLRKIEQVFKDDLFIKQIITNPADMSETEEVDVIISTVPLKGYQKTVTISNFFSIEDKEKLQKVIIKIKTKKKKETINTSFQLLFDENLFKAECSYASQDDALKTMGKKLVDKKYVKNDYVDKLFEREKISSTNFGKVAIPHPIDYYADRTVFEVNILKKPVLWGDSEVSLIIMLVVSKEDYASFQDIFSFIANICMEPLQLNKILKCKNYNEFVKTIISLFESY